MTQKEIIFVTGNPDKLRTANVICKPFGITLKQAVFDIVEIQSEDARTIALGKAMKAYELTGGKPVVVNDDSWAISGLRGFPGPYMKSMHYWFTAEDFLRLTQPLTDRRVMLSQYTVYQDERGQRLFQQDIEGIVLPEIRGRHDTSSFMTLVSFDGGKTSVAENQANDKTSIDNFRTTWHDLGEWIMEERA